MRTRSAAKRDREGNPVSSPTVNRHAAPDSSSAGTCHSPGLVGKGSKEDLQWQSGWFTATYVRARTTRNIAHYLAARAVNGRDPQLNAMVALCTTARFHFPLINTVDSTAAARRSIQLRQTAGGNVTADSESESETSRDPIQNKVQPRRNSGNGSDSDSFGEGNDDESHTCPRMPMRSVLDPHMARLPRRAARSLAHEEASATDSDERDFASDSSADSSANESELASLVGDRLVAIPSESEDEDDDDDNEEEDDLVTQSRIINELSRIPPPARREALFIVPNMVEPSTSRPQEDDNPALGAHTSPTIHPSTSNATTTPGQRDTAADGPAQHTRSRERDRRTGFTGTSQRPLSARPATYLRYDDVARRMRLAMERANALRAALDSSDSDSELPVGHAPAANAGLRRDEMLVRVAVPERLRMRAARVLVRDPFRYPAAASAPRRTFAATLNGRLVFSERSLPAPLNGRLAEYIDRASLFRSKRPMSAGDDEQEQLRGSNRRRRSSNSGKHAQSTPQSASSVRATSCDTAASCVSDWYDCSSSMRVYESLVDTQARRLGMLWREKEYYLGTVNKLFASAWLNDKQVMVATKCNRAFVLDANGRDRKAGLAAMVEISLLRGSGASSPPRNPCGVHALEVNPSGTLLATGGENPNDISVFNLPSLVPHAVFESGHDDWIFDMKWIDDEYLVSGGRDSNLILWKAHTSEPSSSYDARSSLVTGVGYSTGRRSLLGVTDGGDDPDSVPSRYAFLRPLCKRRCEHADKIRAICYNEARLEIVVVSLDGSLHVFDAPSFRQRVTKSLAERHENVCITPSNDRSLYAIGSASHVTLIDARTLRHIVAVQSRYAQQGVRSISFQNSLLTIGTGAGVVLFYDLRARKYLTLDEGHTNRRAGANNYLELHCGNGYLAQDQDYNYMYLHYATNAVYTHAYDPSGTRLFTAGGPLAAGLYGHYAALWH